MKTYRRAVLVQDGNVERALRKLKKKIQDSGLLDELRVKNTTKNPPPNANAKKVRQNLVGANNWRLNNYLLGHTDVY